MSMSFFARLAVGLVVAAGLALGSLPARPADACQIGCTPINLILAPLPNLSNVAPEEATGIVELVLTEGEARGRVVGLPALGEEVYQAWLVNTGTDEALSFGTFATDQERRGQFRFIVEQDIPDRGWNLFLITVEPRQDPEPARQSDKRSIGAFFPGATGRDAAPRSLPNTGGPLSGEPSAPAPPAVLLSDGPAGAIPATDRPLPAPAVTAASSPAAPGLTLLQAAGLAAAGLGGLLLGWHARGRHRP